MMAGMENRAIVLLDARAARGVARSYERTAKNLRSWAAELDARDAMAIATTTKLDLLARSPSLVAAGVGGGLDQAAAEERAASLLGAPLATIQYYGDRLRKRREKAARAARNADIMRLVRVGLTAKEIGAKVGLHWNSVNRLVRAARARD